MATNRKGRGSKAKLRVVNGNANAGTNSSGNGNKHIADATQPSQGATDSSKQGKATTNAPTSKPSARKAGWGTTTKPKGTKGRPAQPVKGETEQSESDTPPRRSRDVLRVVPDTTGAAETDDGDAKAVLGADASQDNGTANEYEYVSFSEWIRPFLEWLAYWGDELRVPIIVIALILVLIVTTLIGRITNTFLIVLAVIIVTLLMSVLIYMAWNSMREARDLYRRAERVYREKNRIEKRSEGSEGISDDKAPTPETKKKGLFGKARR